MYTRQNMVLLTNEICARGTTVKLPAVESNLAHPLPVRWFDASLVTVPVPKMLLPFGFSGPTAKALG
jgi:hypothetical protein